MKLFRDTEGREWKIEVNVTAIKRVRSLVDVDLLKFLEMDQSLVGRLMTDPILLCDVLYALCRPEAESRSISDEEFGRGLHGDVIDQATSALVDEIISFSRSPADRANLQKAVEIAAGAMDQARKVVSEKLATTRPEDLLESALASVKRGSGDVPALSA